MNIENYAALYGLFLTKLRAARLRANLTQKQVAARLRKPQSFISKCETGERRVDFVELLIFAELYDLPLSFFTPTAE